jgi:hypothetical protein
VYRICGIPGFLVALVLVLTVKQKDNEERNLNDENIFESSTIETRNLS